MSSLPERAARGGDWAARYWPVPILRALPALAVGLAITFVADQSPRVGLVALGLFAVASALILGIATLRIVTERITRTVFLIHSIVSLVIGVLALALPGGTVGTLLFFLSTLAAITGFLELYAGLRNRPSAVSRDWITVGAFTAIAALVFLIIPSDTVLAVGMFGAFGILLGVYLVIAGLSLRWGPTTPEGIAPARAGDLATETKAEAS